MIFFSYGRLNGSQHYYLFISIVYTVYYFIDNRMAHFSAASSSLFLSASEIEILKKVKMYIDIRDSISQHLFTVGVNQKYQKLYIIMIP